MKMIFDVVENNRSTKEFDILQNSAIMFMNKEHVDVFCGITVSIDKSILIAEIVPEYADYVNPDNFIASSMMIVRRTLGALDSGLLDGRLYHTKEDTYGERWDWFY